jgi:hypothetical protein
MKQAQSILILAFLDNVKSGLISGRDNSSGPVTLQQMATALQEILNGEDTDKALQIERQAGQPRDIENIKLASLIHQQRKAGEYWSVVAHNVNEWLENEGLKPRKLDHLKTLYSRNRDWLKQRDEINQIVKMVQQDIQQRQK